MSYIIINANDMSYIYMIYFKKYNDMLYIILINDMSYIIINAML